MKGGHEVASSKDGHFNSNLNSSSTLELKHNRHSPRNAGKDPSHPNNPQGRILLPISNGSSGMEIATVSTALGNFAAQVSLAAVSASSTSNEQSMVQLSEGHKIQTHLTIEAAAKKDWDAIIIVGANRLGFSQIWQSKTVKSLLLAQNEKDGIIGVVGVRPAAVLLALAPGVSVVPDATLGDCARDMDLIIEENIVSSKGCGGTLLLALQLGEMLYSKDTADFVARQMMVDRKSRTIRMGERRKSGSQKKVNQETQDQAKADPCTILNGVATSQQQVAVTAIESSQKIIAPMENNNVLTKFGDPMATTETDNIGNESDNSNARAFQEFDTSDEASEQKYNSSDETFEPEVQVVSRKRRAHCKPTSEISITKSATQNITPSCKPDCASPNRVKGNQTMLRRKSVARSSGKESEASKEHEPKVQLVLPKTTQYKRIQEISTTTLAATNAAKRTTARMRMQTSFLEMSKTEDSTLKCKSGKAIAPMQNTKSYKNTKGGRTKTIADQKGKVDRKLFHDIIWKRLQLLDWREEGGLRPSDRYFFPPGVTKNAGRNRVDYFDSLSQVLEHIANMNEAREMYQLYWLCMQAKLDFKEMNSSGAKIDYDLVIRQALKRQRQEISKEE